MLSMVQPLAVITRYQRGLATFRDLESEPFKELLTALQDTPSTTSSITMSSEVADKVHTIAASDVQIIVPALLHVHSMKDALELSASELAASLALGIRQERPQDTTEESQVDEATTKDEFESRLMEVLAIDRLRVIARAAGLLFEHEHTATQFRVVTDIRPIFEGEHPQSSPVGALIVHTLRVSYFADGEEKNFFVALDSSDARELTEQLQRANSKADSLRSVLEDTRIPFVDSE